VSLRSILISNFFLMSLPVERQEVMGRTLGGIADPHERLAVAMGWKTRLGALREEEHTEENRVRGCVSRVWLVAEMDAGRCRFRMDAESPLVRGLVGMICGIYDGATPEEVVQAEPMVMEEAGLLKNLSPTRRNGLAAVRRAIVEFAAKEMAG